jgi:ankyrin repeat protein
MLSDLNKAKLYNAATTGDINLFYYLDRCQEPITEPITDDNTTALHIAAEFGHVAIINFLLSKKADINATNTDGGTPLHMAAQSSNPEVIKSLLENQADVNINNAYRETALHIAIEKQDQTALKELLACPNIKLDPQNHIGNTALHIATKHSATQIIELLLTTGKERNCILDFINLKNHSCKTALDIASLFHYFEVIQLLKTYEQEAIINELVTTPHDRSFFIKRDDSHHRSCTPDQDIHRDSSFVKKVCFSRDSSPTRDFNIISGSPSGSPSGSFIKKESCHDRACFIKKDDSFSRSSTPERGHSTRSFTNKGNETLPDIPRLNSSLNNKQNSPPYRLRKI